MTEKDPRVRSGRFVANVLILGGVLFAAIIGSLLLVLGHWGGEDAPYSESDDPSSVEDVGPRPPR